MIFEIINWVWNFEISEVVKFESKIVKSEFSQSRWPERLSLIFITVGVGTSINTWPNVPIDFKSNIQICKLFVFFSAFRKIYVVEIQLLNLWEMF